MVDWLHNLPLDRIECYWLHFWVGIIVGFIWGRKGLMWALILGLGKEFYDFFDYGFFDVYDWLCTIAGGMVKDIVCLVTGMRNKVTPFIIELIEYITSIKLFSR